jgi:predicted nucleic acid-binding Zn ribbon protein
LASKVCACCNKDKPLSSFVKNNQAADGTTHICKPCKAEKYRPKRNCTQCGNVVEKNQKHSFCKRCQSTYDKERKLKILTEYKQFLQNRGCAACGFNHPGALEVHHLFSEAKRFGRSQSNVYNKQDVENNVAIVLCANCHSIFHSFFGGKFAKFPKQTIESTVEIINNSRGIKP